MEIIMTFVCKFITFNASVLVFNIITRRYKMRNKNIYTGVYLIRRTLFSERFGERVSVVWGYEIPEYIIMVSLVAYSFLIQKAILIILFLNDFSDELSDDFCFKFTKSAGHLTRAVDLIIKTRGFIATSLQKSFVVINFFFCV